MFFSILGPSSPKNRYGLVKISDFSNPMEHKFLPSGHLLSRPDLGNLSVASDSVIAVLRLVKGDFAFVDSGGEMMKGDSKFVAELTVREGGIVWDLNGQAAKPFIEK